jgi:hypothetical protein
MKSALAAIACSLLFLTLTAPSASAQKSNAVSRPQPVAVSVRAPSTPAPGLVSALTDLERVSNATQVDLSSIGSSDKEKNDRSWRNGWRFWHVRSSSPSPSPEAEKAAASLQRNLHDAMPGLIENARSTGSFASTFKLYNNLSVVCELLDSLVKSPHGQGKGDTGLNNDSAAMGRIRQDLATYIEQTAASMDARTQYAATSSAPANTKPPKKIVVDDTVPAKKSKKAATAQQ